MSVAALLSWQSSAPCREIELAHRPHLYEGGAKVAVAVERNKAGHYRIGVGSGETLDAAAAEALGHFERAPFVAPEPAPPEASS